MNQPSRIKRPAIGKILSIDIFLSLFVLFIAYCLIEDKFKSVLVGNLIFIIPNSIFALRSFKEMGAARIQQVVRLFYKSATTKFALTTGLFAYSFLMLQPLDALYLFASYIAIFVIHQFSSFYYIGRKSNT